MKVTRLPFNHESENYIDSIGMTEEMIKDYHRDSDVHLRMFVDSLLSNRRVDPYMLRHSCSYFVSKVKDHLTLDTIANMIGKDKPTLMSINSAILCGLTIGVKHNKVSEVVEHVENNFVDLYDTMVEDDEPSSILALIIILSCYNEYVVDTALKFYEEKETERKSTSATD